MWRNGLISIMTIMVATILIGCSLAKGHQTFEVKESIETSDFKGINIMTEEGHSADATYKVQMVHTGNETLNDLISSYVGKHKQFFLDEVAQKGLKDEKKEKSSFSLEAKLMHVSNRYISIEYTRKEKLPQKEPISRMDTITYDLTKNKQIQMEDLFYRPNGWEKLAEQTKLSILKDEEALKASTYEQISQAFQHPERDLKKFSFTPKGMNIYLDNGKKETAYICFLASENLKGIMEENDIPPVYQTAVDSPEVLSGTVQPTPQNLPSAGKLIALTFDDGPHITRTPRVLDVLKKYNAKATFFVLGEQVQQYPGILQRISAEGHEIGSHTWDHSFLPKLGPVEMMRQIYKTSEVIAKTAGKKPTVLRPPYGASNDQLESLLDVPIVNWSVDTLDWKHSNSQSVLRIVKRDARPGSIILMHDIQQATVEALDEILLYLKSQDYQCVTVSELLGIQDRQEDFVGQVFYEKE